MNIDERLSAELGDHYQEGLTESRIAEIQFRVGMLWSHFPQAAQDSWEPQARVVRTGRANSYTRTLSGTTYVIVDEGLRDLLMRMTWHVVADSPDAPVEVLLQRIFAQRLRIQGRDVESAAVGLLARNFAHQSPPVRALIRPEWEMGDLLVRGQHLFTIAHEMAHAFLLHTDVQRQLQPKFTAAVNDAICELEALVVALRESNLATEAYDDDLRLLTLIDIASEVEGHTLLNPLQRVEAHIDLLRGQLQLPRVVLEATCDFYAAIAVKTALKSHTGHMKRMSTPIALATCVLAIGNMSVLKYLDQSSLAVQREPQATTQQVIARLSLIRGCLYATALRDAQPAHSEEPRLISRAIGDAIFAQRTILAKALEVPWSEVPTLLLTDPLHLEGARRIAADPQLLSQLIDVR